MWFTKRLLFIGVPVLLFNLVVAPPPRREKQEEPSAPGHGPPGDNDKSPGSLNLPYERYLMEVVKELEKDENFQKKMKELPEADVKEGKIAEHIDELGLEIRSRLHDIKVREVERLRQVIQQEIDSGNDDVDFEKHISHIGTEDVNKFDKEDLRKLIKKTVADLDDNDKKRKEEFKEYEMKKEAMRTHKLAEMTEAERVKAEAEYERLEKQHKDHEKIKHPGGKEQLEEVWEEGDGMAGNEFDPTTFFHLHDLDGNGYWDELELEALFVNELDKIYNTSNPAEDDPRERDEEMNRMREHVMSEMDKDGNKMISMQEFLADTKTNDFKDDNEWKGVDEEQQIYTDEELKKYEEALAQQMNWGADAYGTTHPPPAHPDDQHQQQMEQQLHQQQQQIQQLQQQQQQQQQHGQQAQPAAGRDNFHAQAPLPAEGVHNQVPVVERKPDESYGV